MALAHGGTLCVRGFTAYLLLTLSVLWILSAPGAALAQSAGTITVRALIDGRSELRLRANTAVWRHLNFDPPGFVPGADDEPTVINRVVWYQQFPPGAGSCNCDSDVLRCVAPSLPEAELSVAGGTLTVNVTEGVPEYVTVTQEPTAANNFELRIEISDADGGRHFYTFEISFDSPTGVQLPLSQECIETYLDCNGNMTDDALDLAGAMSSDCNGNGQPDECEPNCFGCEDDCDGDAVPDSCEIASGGETDCNADGIPDICQLDNNDCNANGIPDDCDLIVDDCDRNGVVDDCEIASGAAEDCNANGTPDDCDVTDFRLGSPLGILTGENPLAIAAGELDGNFGPELVTANRNSDDVTIISTDGDGFPRSVNHFAVTGEAPVDLALAQLDADGNLDIVTANRDTNNVSVLWGDGAGGVVATSTLAVGDSPVFVVTDRIDADGTEDLVVANRDDGTVSVILNQGARTFAPATVLTLPAGASPGSVAVADLDGAGGVDVVASNRTSGTFEVLIFFGVGDGTFGGPNSQAAGSRSLIVAAADVDGVNGVDLVHTSLLGKDLTLLKNTTGAGTFDAPVALAGPGNSGYVTTGDLNDDGEPDIIAVSRLASTFKVFLNDGAGGFGREENYSLDRPAAVVATDLTGDGKLDLGLVRDRVDTAAVILSFLNDVSDDNGNSIPDDCEGDGVALTPGDVNIDGSVNIADPVSVLNFLFAAATFDPCLMAGPGAINAAGAAVANWNGDPSVNIADPVAALNFLFGGGSQHALSADANCTIVEADCDELCVP